MNTKLETMIKMQNEFNCKIHPEWEKQNYPFHLAVLDEIGEALNHYGWKWWTEKKEPNIPMLKLEMVDIWCFLMSHAFKTLSVLDLDWVVEKYTFLDKKDASISDFKIEIGNLYDPNLCFSYRCFFRCLLALDMTFDELYKLYVGKMALNKLRQDMGYREGKYKKTWCFKDTDYMEVEDNEYMYTFCEHLTSEDPELFKRIYKKLLAAYVAVEETNHG